MKEKGKIIKIGINASFVRKLNTGVGQVSLNALKALRNFQFPISNFQSNPNSQTSKLEFYIYLEEDIDLNLPDNFNKRIFLPWWKRDDLIRKIWWEKYLLPKKVKEDKCDIFLSLYQCPTVFKFSLFRKGRIKEGFEKLNKEIKIPLNPPLKKGEVKHIMIVHDIIPKLFPEYLDNFRKKIYWKLTERAIKKADKIIAVSKYTKEDLIKHLKIDERKISVNYIDVDEIYKKEVSEEKNQEVLKKYNLKPGYIYSGGGLDARKNVERLLKAYKFLVKQIPSPKLQIPNKSQIQNLKLKTNDFQLPDLVISGKLMPELAPLITDVEKLVEDLGLQDKVKLLGFVPQEDMPALYKNASVFVYPSLYEGFGLPVLEAMNCGTPVVASNASSIPEIVSFQIPPNPPLEKGEASKFSPFRKGGSEGGFEKSNNYAALLFNPKNTKDIAKKIEKVLSDNNLRNELSAKGKEQAKKFSWEKFVNCAIGAITNQN